MQFSDKDKDKDETTKAKRRAKTKEERENTERERERERKISLSVSSHMNSMYLTRAVHHLKTHPKSLFSFFLAREAWKNSEDARAIGDFLERKVHRDTD
jgi:hypothetical protein